ncbi:hypothetical protein ACTXT7_005470 [Hymenolepis weldensis]
MFWSQQMTDERAEYANLIPSDLNQNRTIADNVGETNDQTDRQGRFIFPIYNERFTMSDPENAVAIRKSQH